MKAIREYEQEWWTGNEETLIVFLIEELGLARIGIEHVHRVARKDWKNNLSRTIVLKFSSFKGKEQFFEKVNQLKETDLYIHEDYSKKTFIIRKEIWQEVIELIQKGKYAILVYDKVVRRENKRSSKSTS